MNVTYGGPVLALRILIAMSIGRAMTLPFIARAGDGADGDPPAAWLMPLVGDAAVGIAAIGVLYLTIAIRKPWAWTVAVVWSAIATFDALAAFAVDVQSPWPDFFMLEIFGRPMFFAAAAMHAIIIWLLTQQQARDFFVRQHA